MQYDKMEKIGASVIQHGKYNDRVYIMHLEKEDVDEVFKYTEKTAQENNYSKIFAKIPASLYDHLDQKEYLIEAKVPLFFNGEEDVLFLSKYIDPNRQIMTDEIKQEVENNIAIAESKAGQLKLKDIDNEYTIRLLEHKDAIQLAELYKIVFETYPFPIHDPEFLKEMMDDNIEYWGIFLNDKLVSAASSEQYKTESVVEMTDFATNPDYLGKGFALHLLKRMEQSMFTKGYKTLYTIARSLSPAMNITFAKDNYKFAGTLVNNTNIFGKIEPMNVWYKPI